MRQTVKERTVCASGGMPDVLQQWLPPRVSAALAHVGGCWEEVHLHVGRAASVTVEGENRRVDVSLNAREMEELVMRLCEGSLYAHRESLAEGYIALAGGIRVGVCGQAIPEGGRLLGVRAVDTLCIRFPHALRDVGEGVIGAIRAHFPQGALVYAPPGQGKTTLLRALACRFGDGEPPLRVAVVDTRRELDDGGFVGQTCLSLLSGYPKGLGIEIAARTMNAQVILCDEIGSGEVATVLSCANYGVPVIASAHAATLDGLLARPGMRELHRAAVFGCYVGIRRQAGRRDFLYDITPRREMMTEICS